MSWLLILILLLALHIYFEMLAIVEELAVEIVVCAFILRWICLYFGSFSLEKVFLISFGIRGHISISNFVDSISVN